MINFIEILNIMEENEATNQRIQEIKRKESNQRHSLYRHPSRRQSTSDVASEFGSEVESRAADD